jgi:hypothetical protein
MCKDIEVLIFVFVSINILTCFACYEFGLIQGKKTTHERFNRICNECRNQK